jgi:hypothetical protein
MVFHPAPSDDRLRGVPPAKPAKRRTVKKPKFTPLTPEQIAAQQEEQRKYRLFLVQQAEIQRQEDAARALRQDAELAADKRPRWMREHVVDPEWKAASDKALKQGAEHRLFPLGKDMLDCVGKCMDKALNNTLGTAAQLVVAKSALDKTAPLLPSETDGRREIAEALALLVNTVLELADDTLPEDGKPGATPDHDKVRKQLQLSQPLHLLKLGFDNIIQKALEEKNEGKGLGDELHSDLCAHAQDEVVFDDLGADVLVEYIRSLSMTDRHWLCQELSIPTNSLDLAQ